MLKKKNPISSIKGTDEARTASGSRFAAKTALDTDTFTDSVLADTFVLPIEPVDALQVSKSAKRAVLRHSR